MILQTAGMLFILIIIILSTLNQRRNDWIWMYYTTLWNLQNKIFLLQIFSKCCIVSWIGASHSSLAFWRNYIFILSSKIKSSINFLNKCGQFVRHDLSWKQEQNIDAFGRKWKMKNIIEYRLFVLELDP